MILFNFLSFLMKIFGKIFVLIRIQVINFDLWYPAKQFGSRRIRAQYPCWGSGTDTVLKIVNSSLKGWEGPT